MTIETIRQAFVAAVEAAKAGFSDTNLEIQYENRNTVDPLRQTKPYLAVEVQLGPGWQADLNDNPIHRITGLLILVAKDKDGKGTAGVNSLLAHFYPKLQRRRIGPSLTEMAAFPGGKTVNGIYGQSAVIPFTSDITYGT
jgi:hypothetical protein